ncbi:MAG: efflux RND transporter periplasmic adaptor subunit [Gammaproteobacteria bacterium]|nr:efflux RND transporter periplasmic adaptor subunit [Gammaproteobacteria bacterium]
MLKLNKTILLSTLLLSSLSSLSSYTVHADAVRVTSQTLSEIAIFPESSVPATALSLNNAKLSAEVQATVKVFPVLVGDIVKRNEVLIQLDDRNYKLNLLKAEVALKGIESRLSLAKYQLEQANTLSKEKAISNEHLEQRKAEVNTVKAEHSAQKVAIAMAKKDLGKCTITAPFDAIIVERIAQVGELASIGSPLLRIIDATRIEVSAKIQSQDIASMQQAKNFQFVTQDGSYDVQLRKITPAFDPIQRNREARFLFSKERALSGSNGTLQWKQSQPYIPANMLTRRGGQLGIFVINGENLAEFIAIKKAQEGRPAASELPGSIRIIVNGRFAIQDGMTVSID